MSNLHDEHRLRQLYPANPLHGRWLAAALTLALAIAWVFLPTAPMWQIGQRAAGIALLLWISIGLGLRATLAALAAFAVAGMLALHTGGGPFADPQESVARAKLATFIAFASLISLLMAFASEELRHAYRKLTANEERYRSLAGLSSDWYWEQDANFRFVALQGELEERTGISVSAHLGLARWDMPALNLSEADWDAHKAVLHAHLPFRDFEMRRPDQGGKAHWVSISGIPLFDASGTFTGYRGIGQDITSRKLAEQQLAESEARFRALTDLSADWYWEQDANFRFTGLSRHNSTKAYAHGSFNVGMTRWEVPYVDMPEAVWDAHRAQLARHEVFRDFEVKRQEADGSISYYAVSGMPRFDAQGRFSGYHGVGSDITPRRSAEEAAKRLAHYDTLTQLPNRALFMDRLAHELQRAQRSGFKVAVLLLDLDHFKEVNDTLGHDEGDRLLIQAGARVRASVRQTDTVARLGGDEFVVILSDLGDRPAIETVAQTIITRLADPFELHTGSGHVSASVGIALYPDDAQGQEGLLKAVDQAMYAAKAAGRNRFSFFTPDLQEAAQNRMWLTNEMHVALDSRQFWIAFQPIVTLATGAVHKAEALIRWRHPQRGMISPGEFIPVAESCGLINPIGDWVFQQAAHQAAHCRKRYHPGFQISVNKSPVQFHNTRQATLPWSLQLQRLGLDGDSIVAEITEGLLLDNSDVVATKLQDFREAGIQVALDDFGTGFSSLSYLQKHDIDYVKIDQAFVRNLQDGSKDFALCEAIVVMAHKLGIAVIAEGVETQAQCDLLLRAGCDYGQGYLFARPMPADELDAFLAARAAP